MTVIVKSAWKNKKIGDEVEYKGELYTIGYDAFATVEAAAARGRINNLVIVDKKLTSPVGGKNIESAATDIFESVVTNEMSKDGKTETTTIKFAAAAGGTLLDSYMNSLKFTPVDDQNDKLGVVKLSAATKSYSFTATAKVNTAMTAGDVEFYGKVEANGLKSIGSVVNAKRSDDILFDNRKYSSLHYGDGSMTEDIYAEATKITAMNVDATAAGVTIRGTAAKLTAATGHILGYGNVTLSNVIVGGHNPVIYAGGKYAYTSKTDKDGKFIATSTSTAAGKLSISSAKAAEDATFAVEGFKNVSINITVEGTAAPVFTSIIGGIETAQLTNGHLDYTTYAVSGTLDLTTTGGTVDNVAGFEKVNLKDTDAGTIAGYAVTAKKTGNEWTQETVGKSAVTFENTAAAENTIGTIDNAKSVIFKALDDMGTDFDIGAI